MNYAISRTTTTAVGAAAAENDVVAPGIATLHGSKQRMDVKCR